MTAPSIVVVDTLPPTTIFDSLEAPVNAAFLSTGAPNLSVGTVVTFQLRPTRNGLPWPVASATLTIKDQIGGGSTSVSASVSGSGYAVTATWTVPAVTDTNSVTGLPYDVVPWTRSWSATGVDGAHQVSLPIGFNQVASP